LIRFETIILCSITEGTSPTDWKDVSDNVEISWEAGNIARFSGNVSGRFWIIFVDLNGEFSRKNTGLKFKEKIIKNALELYEITLKI
jgi:hypothetical protein